jgi:hypothetical protein
MFAFCSPSCYVQPRGFQQVLNACFFIHWVKLSGTRRLVDTVGEAQSRGRNLSRLRCLTASEQAFLDRREQAAEAQLKAHELQHRCQS